MKTTFTRKKAEAENIFSFYFKPEKPVHYVAGQFTEIYLPHKNHDNRGEKRWFTLSSSPHKELLTITTNFSQDGSSFKKELKNLAPGQQISLASPMGDFVLPKNAAIPLIFVAGGIGVTPFHSIISWLNSQNQERQIILIYAADHLEKVAFKTTLVGLGKNFKVILKKPKDGWKGLSGKLSAKLIQSTVKITPKHYIYLAGPEPMVEIISKDLKDAGVNKQHIFTDYFPGYKF